MRRGAHPPPVTVVIRTRVTESLSTPSVKVQSHVQTVYPLLTRNYKISATVGVTTVVAKPVKAILDTGAGPNIVRPDVFPEDLERHRVVGESKPNFVGVGGRRLLQKGAIDLYVQVGSFRTKTRFVVVVGRAAECILGCQFINRHVLTIPPK